MNGPGSSNQASENYLWFALEDVCLVRFAVLLQHACMGSILEVRDLRVAYGSRGGDTHQALDGISFCLESGEVLGILGESGSGKSTLATSILGLFRGNAVVASGAVLFEGRDLLQANPGQQVRQVLAAHGMNGGVALNQKTREVLETVFTEKTERIARSYPHQLSGGQRQRVLIAQAIACGPCLVIADEPTASLDPTTQMEMLGVFRALRRSLGLAMIFITHNPALLAGFSDRVLVLYAGRVVELGLTEEVLSWPKHPYTRSLFQSIPVLPGEPRDASQKKLPSIPGDSRPSSLPEAGCPFEPRCSERMDTCKSQEPGLVNLSETHVVSCFRYEKS